MLCVSVCVSVCVICLLSVCYVAVGVSVGVSAGVSVRVCVFPSLSISPDVPCPSVPPQRRYNRHLNPHHHQEDRRHVRTR